VKVCLALLILELKTKLAQEEFEMGRLFSPEEREERIVSIKKNIRDSTETEKATGALRKCPICRAPYMKVGGCLNMQCMRCKRRFTDRRDNDELGILATGS
jgi:hypothetical protein